MSSTLYLLRQRTEHISPSLFLATETDKDVIFIEKALPAVPSSLKVAYAADEKRESGLLINLTYDDLIDKIFSSDHIVVL